LPFVYRMYRTGPNSLETQGLMLWTLASWVSSHTKDNSVAFVYRTETNSLETQALMNLGKLGLISGSQPYVYRVEPIKTLDPGSYVPWQAGSNLKFQIQLSVLAFSARDQGSYRPLQTGLPFTRNDMRYSLVALCLLG
jgi:hypothetical protein